MKTAILKAAFITVLVVIFCVSFTYLVGYFRGIATDKFALMLSLILPLVTAFPTLLYVILRNNKLSSAYLALEKAHTELQAHAKIDHMTGLYNREAFFEMVKNVRMRIDSGALILIDADHFKNINDKFGHALGDRALKLIAFALQNVTRKGDLVGRVGGEEFCIYLPQANSKTAMRVAERVRIEIASTRLYVNGDQTIPLTISAGGVTARKHESNSQVLSRADHCLYEAKNQGRNIVVFEKEDASGNTSLSVVESQTQVHPLVDERRRTG